VHLNKAAQGILSVGVPAFNQGKYLRATLDSLLSQTIAPLEIVVSDNHSTDETADVLREYQGRVRVIKPEAHLDMMANWNFLVSNLIGEWFAILSSDDIAKPNYVETLLRGINRAANSVLVRAGWESIDESGRVLEKRYLLSVKKITSPPHNFLEQLQGPKVSFAAFAVRKDIWCKVKGFSEQLKLCGDWGLWLSIAPYGDFIYEQDIISQYRVDHRPWHELVSTRLISHIRDVVFIYKNLIPEAAKKLSISDELIAKASKKALLNQLVLASQNLDGVGLEDAGLILHSWAKDVKCENKLADMLNGKKFSSCEFWGNNTLRKIYSFLYRKV
jgi:glycosyltransferase involved in cell wall biosynthesis